MRTLLSIVILHLPLRHFHLLRLLKILNPQLTDEVEVIVYEDNYLRKIGYRRNLATQAAQGEYICSIDDDDTISENYVSSILKAIKENPDADAIGFKYRYFQNSEEKGYAIMSNRFQNRRDTAIDGKVVYERLIYHLNPVKAHLVHSLGFKDLFQHEDFDFAERLKPLIKKEAFIDDFLYNYLWITYNSRETTARPM